MTEPEIKIDGMRSFRDSDGGICVENLDGTIQHGCRFLLKDEHGEGRIVTKWSELVEAREVRP